MPRVASRNLRFALCVFPIVASLLALTCLSASPLPAAMTVYTVDGLTRVQPDAPPLATILVSIKAARNEYEPFQIVVHASGKKLEKVNVEASDFHSDDGYLISRRNITFYREQYVKVTQPSPKSTTGAGWYPDALIPFLNPINGHMLKDARFVGAPFQIEPNANQPVWVDVFVPKDASPGFYSGTVKVTATNQTAATAPVRLTVWNFTLPETPSMRSIFGGLGQRIAAAHNVAENSTQYVDLERQYAEALAAHRISPPIPSRLYPTVKPDGSLDPAKNHAALREWIQHFHVTSFRIFLLGDDPLGRDRERNKNYLRAIYAFLKAKGWEKFAYIYVLDEPHDAAAYEQVRQRARFIHESQPGIKVLCTVQPTPQDPSWGTLVGSVDIWVPLWTLFDEKAAAERLAAGEELWSYTALVEGAKGRDTPYWELDFPLLDYRLPTWMSWRYGQTGLLYWTTVYWEKTGDVWTDPATYYGAGSSIRFNDEGSLFYPGKDAGFAGPVASMRLKQIREGLEDYEYFRLLTDRGKMRVAADVVKRLASSWTQWDDNPPDLYAAREELAANIVAASAPTPNVGHVLPARMNFMKGLFRKR